MDTISREIHLAEVPPMLPAPACSVLGTAWSPEMDQLADALAKAQGAMQLAELDKVNPHFKSSYASLASVWQACRAPLAANGIAVIQHVLPSDEEGRVGMLTRLIHRSGQWAQCELRYKPTAGGPNPLQQLGGVLSYLRRYSLAPMVGVTAGDEDDGEAQQGSNDKATAEKKAPAAERAQKDQSTPKEPRKATGKKEPEPTPEPTPAPQQVKSIPTPPAECADDPSWQPLYNKVRELVLAVDGHWDSAKRRLEILNEEATAPLCASDGNGQLALKCCTTEQLRHLKAIYGKLFVEMGATAEAVSQ